MIDSMFQGETDVALDDQVSRPARLKPPTVGFWSGFGTAAPRGVGAAVSEAIAFGAEIAGAFGQVQGAYGGESAGGMFAAQTEQERQQAAEARLKLGRNAGPDFSNEAGDIFRARARDIMPDPATTGTAGQLTAGIANFASKAVGYGITLGPLGPVALGADVGMTEADRLRLEGVDKGTRTAAGAVAGALAGASVVVPLTGATAGIRFAKGAATGVGAISGTSAAERAILRAAGYDKLADTFDPLDPVALAMGVVPGAIGAKFGRPVRTEAQMRDAARLTPAEQARENAYEASPTNLAELERAIKAEKRPEVRAELVKELEKQRAAAGNAAVEAAVKTDPDLVPAARVVQTAEALDAARLTPDEDIAGRDRHVSAVEMAADQMARGEPVNVAERVSIEQMNLARAYDAVWTDPKGPKFDPLVMIRPEDIEATAVARGGWKGLGDAEVKGQGFGLVKFIWRHGEESGKPAELQVTREDVVAVPEVVRNFEPTVHTDQRGNAFREWRVERPGPGGEPRQVVYVDKPMGDAGRHMVSMYVQEAGRAGADAPLSKKVPDRSAESPGKRADAGPGDTQPAVLRLSGQQGSDGASVARKPAGAEPAAAGIERAAAEVERLNPDMLVQLEGMDAPMRVGDLMERVRQEAADDNKFAQLVQVAAQCAITG